jgi:hypothetical protein
MVHDGADGPASLDSVRVQFDEPRLVCNAGLLIAAPRQPPPARGAGQRVGVAWLPGTGCGPAGAHGDEHPWSCHKRPSKPSADAPRANKQGAAMRSASVAEYDIADARPLSRIGGA